LASHPVRKKFGEERDQVKNLEKLTAPAENLEGCLRKLPVQTSKELPAKGANV